MIQAIAPQTVLVVENEAIIRMMATDALEDSGLTVLEAADACDALLLLSQHPEIDLLFTDINMPGTIDGLDLAVRALRDRPELRLIMSSGRNCFPGRAMPDDGKFLEKPYDMNTLVDLVHDELSPPAHQNC